MSNQSLRQRFKLDYTRAKESTVSQIIVTALDQKRLNRMTLKTYRKDMNNMFPFGHELI